MDNHILEGFLNAVYAKPTASDVARRWERSKSAASQIAVTEKLLDGFIGAKTAQKAMDEEAHELLSKYVAFTRAMSLLHQQNHWAAIHYGDHLLFERLYDEVQDELVDAAAERVIGLCGSLLFEGTEAVIAKKFAPKEKTLLSLLESSLAIEEAFQKLGKFTYDTIKEKDMMTLGLDDLIMAQSSVGESHLYLLKQAIKGYSE